MHVRSSRQGIGLALLIAAIIPWPAMAAMNITSFDSTQPRGFGGLNDPLNPNKCPSGSSSYSGSGGWGGDGSWGGHDWSGGGSSSGQQNLCPVVEGFWAPQRYAAKQSSIFNNWRGMMMGNAARDPAFFATLSTRKMADEVIRRVG